MRLCTVRFDWWISEIGTVHDRYGTVYRYGDRYDGINFKHQMAYWICQGLGLGAWGMAMGRALVRGGHM